MDEFEHHTSHITYQYQYHIIALYTQPRPGDTQSDPTFRQSRDVRQNGLPAGTVFNLQPARQTTTPHRHIQASHINKSSPPNEYEPTQFSYPQSSFDFTEQILKPSIAGKVSKLYFLPLDPTPSIPCHLIRTSISPSE